MRTCVLRDRLIALIGSLNGDAGSGAAGIPAADAGHRRAKTARDLAAHLEQGDAGALWDLIAASAAEQPRAVS